MRISSTLARVLVIALLTLALGLAPAIPVHASSGDSAGWFDTLISWFLGAPDGTAQLKPALTPNGSR